MDILQEEQNVTFECGEYQVLAITVDGEPVSKLNYDDQLVWEPTSEGLEFEELGGGECCLYTTAEYLPEKVIIPAIHNGMKVTEIWSYAFSERSGMKYLYIPHTIKKISDAAFKKCPDLEEVILPQNSELEELGDSVFRNSDSLCRINLENATKLKTIPRNAFRNCGGLYDMTLPPNLEVIEPWAFFWSGIGRVTFPRTLQTIGTGAFCCCPGFSTPVIPKSVTNVGFWAFLFGGLGEGIRIEAEDRPSGWSPFWAYVLDKMIAEWNITGDSPINFKYSDDYDCEAYAGDPDFIQGDLIIPNEGSGRYEGEEVEAIADWGFSGCIEITKISIGDTVVRIGDHAFHGCTSLETIEFGDNVTTIGNYAFSGCENITEVEIPYGVTAIGDGAFEGCGNLQTLKIPNSVTFIGQDAFNGCSQNLLVICDKLEAENPFVPHVHVWSGWEEVIAPSCSVEGHYKRTCSNCNATETKYTPTSPHTWDDGRVTTEATCTSEGNMSYTCIDCGATKTESISVTEHSYGDAIYYEPTSEEGDKYVYTCTKCGNSYEEPGDNPAIGYSVKIYNGSSYSLGGYSFPIFNSDEIPERIYKGESFTITTGATIDARNQIRFPSVEVTGATYVPSVDEDDNPFAVRIHLKISNPYDDIVIALT